MKRRRLHSRQVVHRIFVCKSLDACIGLAIGHAAGSGDRDLRTSLERVEALLDHEMKTFLQLPVGVRDDE